MKRIFHLWFFLVSAAGALAAALPAQWAGFPPPVPAGSTAYTVQMLLPFESGSAGDAIDATYMNANDIGTPPGNWAIDTTSGRVNTSEIHQLTTPVIVGGTTYTTVGGTRSCTFTNRGYAAALCGFDEGYRTNSVTLAFWFKNTLEEPDTQNQTYDLASLGNEAQGGLGGQFSVFQMQNWSAHAHSGNSTNNSGKGPEIALHRDTWYWVVLANVRASGTFLTIYNEAGGVVGTSSIEHSFGSTNGVRFIEFGQRRNNTGLGVAVYDNVVITWGANPSNPIGP